MKKTLTLFLFLILLVIPIGYAIDSDKGYLIPTSQPKQSGFFNFLSFVVAPTTINGQYCDGTADATIRFTSTATTMGIGNSCGSTANVYVAQCANSDCSNYYSMGTQPKFSDITPAFFNNLVVGNEYIYFCYNCVASSSGSGTYWYVVGTGNNCVSSTTNSDTTKTYYSTENQCINSNSKFCYYCAGSQVATTGFPKDSGTVCSSSTTPPTYNTPPTCGACVPNWQCATSGGCVNNVQNLVCYDANNCNVNTGKPAETRLCTTLNCAQVITYAKDPNSNECNQYPTSCIPTGWTKVDSCPTTPPVATPTTNFKLSGLKRITGVTELPSGAVIDSPILYSSYVIGSGEIFSITVTNIGTQASAPTLEAFFISKDNTFARSKEANLCITPLQSVFGVSGIENKQLSTCKNDKGAVYTLSSMIPQEEKTFYIYVPYPRSQEQGGSASEYTLAGNYNYNKDKQYFVDVSIISGCQNSVFYNEIGGTLNYNVGSGCILGESGANQTIVDAIARQKTINKSDISRKTSNDLLKSACSTDDVCSADATCESINSLIKEDYYTQSKADQDIKEIQQKITTVLGTVGGTIGGLAAGVGLGEAIPAICGVSLATGVFSIPICLTATTIGGAYLGGSLSTSINKLIQDTSANKYDSLGYCVPKEDNSASNVFMKTLTSIGKSINGIFGGKASTGLSDATVGWILIGLIAAIIFMPRK